MTREVFSATPHELLFGAGNMFQGLEARKGSPAAQRVHTLIEQSRDLYLRTADPRGVIQPISVTEFEEIYEGEGGNDEDTPLEHVIEDADAVALFAVTLGEALCQHISDFFEADNSADGYVLDQIASFAADELAQIAAKRFHRPDRESGRGVLPYSPGYCGWNVSGQRALFAALSPGEIGISINDSCLMHPVKSVSGVLVVAPISAHDFSPAFPCCVSCTTLACQDRIETLKAGRNVV